MFVSDVEIGTSFSHSGQKQLVIFWLQQFHKFSEIVHVFNAFDIKPVNCMTCSCRTIIIMIKRNTCSMTANPSSSQIPSGNICSDRFLIIGSKSSSVELTYTIIDLWLTMLGVGPTNPSRFHLCSYQLSKTLYRAFTRLHFNDFSSAISLKSSSLYSSRDKSGDALVVVIESNSIKIL